VYIWRGERAHPGSWGVLSPDGNGKSCPLSGAGEHCSKQLSREGLHRAGAKIVPAAHARSEVAEEVGVVVGGFGGRGTGDTDGAAEDPPGDHSDQREEDDDDEPQRFGQAAYLFGIGLHHVHHCVDGKGDQK